MVEVVAVPLAANNRSISGRASLSRNQSCSEILSRRQTHVRNLIKSVPRLADSTELFCPGAMSVTFVVVVSRFRLARLGLERCSVGLPNGFSRKTYAYRAGAARLGVVDARTARRTIVAKRIMDNEWYLEDVKMVKN